MATGKITKRSVDALQAGPRDLFLWDDEVSGFGVKITPAGRRVYVLQYRLGGRGAPVKRFTIGQHGVFTPEQARAEARRLAAMVTQGVDPSGAKQERNRQAVDLAFPKYAERFLSLYVRDNWKASYSSAESILRLHVTPLLKSKALPAIRRADLVAVLDGIPQSQPALRRLVFAVMRRLFRWAVSRGDILISPVDGMEAPAGAPSRDRVLADDELKAVWQASEGLGYPFGPFYRLLIVTAQRREEVGGLAWDELDRDASLWTLPAARAKNGAVNLVHLSPLAMALLDDLAALAGCEAGKWPARGLVFSTTGKTAISGYSKGKARLDAAVSQLAQVEAWRVHDLRRTTATGLQRLGIRFEVVEAVLNHISGSKSGIAGIYQRHDWRDEKRAALNAWSAFVSDLLTASDQTHVVPLARASADGRGG